MPLPTLYPRLRFIYDEAETFTALGEEAQDRLMEYCAYRRYRYPGASSYKQPRLLDIAPFVLARENRLHPLTHDYQGKHRK
ncbi:hypothetical protein I6I10_06850 [Corynebacterium glucuronolyticum]|uniref:Uncharacterized protein n=1 Tax=Corynebacterium glucuronolyticum TaxID=39791 RepID=A0A7T4JW52_9CORY|nr:hypothetical protein [Corynebacterium glucuronolyticum]QQB45329.1 hypothetical protein I6I10_07225 [Corynebacterium glucuronolyticum]QQB47580.1 hypothetical protein I6I10_06850 [Corynebacterium glucuronolyticum]WKD64059.1 hypothetical protein CGLUCO_09070 [Corynebacterium glucuronolyticum DSM 44120]SMB82278.1 hypothetical protein SAMN05660745_02604 [Corynebacterium glucuronolyticum]